MLIFLICTFLYFTPTIQVLCNHDKKNKRPTIVVNVFLGWTFVGWVVALAMALSND